MSEQTMTLDRARTARLRAALADLLGINLAHVDPDSITMEWDHESARVRWSGYAELTPEKAAQLVTDAVGATG